VIDRVEEYVLCSSGSPDDRRVDMDGHYKRPQKGGHVGRGSDNTLDFTQVDKVGGVCIAACLKQTRSTCVKLNSDRDTLQVNGYLKTALLKQIKVVLRVTQSLANY